MGIFVSIAETNGLDASTQIREAVAFVAALRTQQTAEPARLAALLEVKRFQAQRFRGSHADLLADARHGPASRFFLEELYSERDYALRDAQFTRIAGALQRFFPARVVQTAVAMSGLHRLTEALDDAMSQAWLHVSSDMRATNSQAMHYSLAWRVVGQRTQRDQQLVQVLQLGRDLDELTRKPGLRTALRLMRKPASAAGLAELQAFLERGFDTFAAMRGADHFLTTIRERETRWITTLSEADLVDCEQTLLVALARA
jgi:hypothetical protein